MAGKHPESEVPIPYLPLTKELKDGKERVILEDFKEEDAQAVYDILGAVAREDIFIPRNKFDPVAYRTDPALVRSFVVRLECSKEVIATFYMRKNFPGKSSHISGAGFFVRKDHRGKGLLQIMLKVYLRIARDLGFTISLFNLVYALNKAAVHAYLKTGFKQVGCIPGGGIIKDVGPTDVLIFYCDLTTLDEEGNPVNNESDKEKNM